MNFTINTRELQKAINFAGKAIPSSAITPIFECILMEAKNTGTLVVTGSDTNTTLSTRVTMSEHDLDGADSVKIAAPYAILAATLATLPDTGITLTYTHEGIAVGIDVFTLRIEQESNVFKLSCEDPTTYLRMPQMPQSDSIKIPAQILQRGIDQVVHCASTDTMRPAICGVNIQVEDGLAEFTTTDMHGLADHVVEYPDKSLSRQMIVPSRFATLVSELIGDDKSEMELKISDRFVRVLIGDWAAYGTLIDDRFPDFKRAIPLDFKHSARVNAEELKTILKRAVIYANMKTFAVKLTFRGNNLFVQSENTDKNTEANQDMRIESEIEDFTIGFNKKMLDKVLKTVSGDFTICMNEPNIAAVIFPDCDEGETTKYLCMPVMLNTYIAPAPAEAEQA